MSADNYCIHSNSKSCSGSNCKLWLQGDRKIRVKWYQLSFVRNAASDSCPRLSAEGWSLAIIGDHARLFKTFTRHHQHNQRHKIQAKSALLLIVDRQLRTAALLALFPRVFDILWLIVKLGLGSGGHAAQRLLSRLEVIRIPWLLDSSPSLLTHSELNSSPTLDLLEQTLDPIPTQSLPCPLPRIRIGVAALQTDPVEVAAHYRPRYVPQLRLVWKFTGALFQGRRIGSFDGDWA